MTTAEGSGYDYTVSTNQVRFLYRRPDPPEDITFIFRIDAIAQEENETIILELVTTSGTNAPPSGDGVFFKNTINLTIVDSDSKRSVVTMYIYPAMLYGVIILFLHNLSAVEVLFTKDKYRAHENPNNNPCLAGFLPVRVYKTSRIANPIVLDVIPLTVEMANTDLLDAEIPVFNHFSPPYAGNISYLFYIL